MPDLAFDLTLDRGGFRLAAAGAVPLAGVTAIVGPSGGGKTTLLRALAGIEPAARGRVFHGGEAWQDGARFVPPHRRGVGFVFQDARLFPHLTVRGNLHFGARRRPGAEIGRIVAALGLAPLMRRRPADLSGGETRRVALGRALASAPRILFLDEPLAGLDSARKAEILAYIDRIAGAFDLPILYVSHAAEEIAALADRVLRVADGRSAGWDPPPLRLPPEVLSGAPAGAADAEVLVVPQSGLVVAGRHPGPLAGGHVIAARLVAATERAVRIEVGGTLIDVPGAAPLGAPGEPVWLICPGVRFVRRRREPP